MASALKTCDEVLKKLDACQIQHMARMHEGLICQAIADYGPSSRIFVRSHDGGSNDCGLYLGEDPLPDDLTAKLFQQSTGLQRGRVILPMDIKSFGWCVDTHGGLYHTFHLTRKQCKTCQVLLLGSALDPNLVAVLPTSCLNPKGQLKKKTEDPIDFYFTLRWQFSLLQAPAFPPAFAPAVVPISQLGEMMIRLAAWMKGESDIWQNPYTGVMMNQIAQMEMHGIKALKPSFTLHKNASDAVGTLYRAFEKYSSKYRLKNLQFQPLLGDFKIEKTAQPRDPVFVEHKLNHIFITMQYDNSEDVLIKHQQAALGFTNRIIFEYRCQWDYLFTARPPFALFIHRDDIPLHWWNAPAGEMLSWRMEKQVYDRQVLNLQKIEEVVSRMTAILEDRNANATKAIPLPSMRESMELVAGGTADHAGEDGDEAAIDEPPVEASPSQEKRDRLRARRLTNGFGDRSEPNPRGNVYQQWAAHALMAACRVRGEGVVLELGFDNDLCFYAWMPYSWSKRDKDRFDIWQDPPRRVWHCHKATPVVPLSFVRLSWINSDQPLYIYDTTIFPCSIAVCDMFHWSNIRIPHGRFLVPAEELIKPTSKTVRRRPFRLKNGIIDQYLVDEDGLVAHLLYIVSGRESLELGRCRRHFATERLVSSLQSLLEGGVQRIGKLVRDRVEDRASKNSPQHTEGPGGEESDVEDPEEGQYDAESSEAY